MAPPLESELETFRDVVSCNDEAMRMNEIYENLHIDSVAKLECKSLSHSNVLSEARGIGSIF